MTKGSKKKKENFYKNTSNTEKQDKIDFTYAVPRNDSQVKLMRYLTDPDCKIIMVSGPAGTGKTLFSVEQGIKHFIGGKYNKIVFTRPTVGVDEQIGFLPGTLEEKMAPWMRPIYDIFHNFMTQKDVEQLIAEQKIEISPLGFMRGRTFKNTWIVADEMQNSSVSQMKMLLTRIGENTRLIITGDCEQNDLKNNENGLEDFLNKLKGRRSNSIGSVEFDTKDVEREAVVREVLEIYKTNNVPYTDISNNNISGNTKNDNENNN